MVIKGAKDQLVLTIVEFMMLLVVVGYTLIEDGSQGVLLLIMFIPCFYMIIMMVLNQAMTVVMDEGGCTTCVLGYKRFYPWDELAVKRIDTDIIVYRSTSRECAIFSPRPIHKPRRLDPSIYSWFRMPGTFICVYFTHNGKNIYGKENFTVTKSEFMEKMEEWHVVLTVNDKKRRGCLF